LKSSIVYGPVKSRRLGLDLGLNISPRQYKLCTFNCVYCQYGWTEVFSLGALKNPDDQPSPYSFKTALESVLKAGPEIESMTFSGNGEPTMHPQFAELVDIALGLKRKYFPQIRLGVLSNSTTVIDKNVRQALEKLDFRLMKLDAGDLKTFKSINIPDKSVKYSEMIEGLKSLKNVIIQTMFVNGSLQNSNDEQVNTWIERLKEIRPLRVQVYSLDRPPADTSLLETPEARLRAIAASVEKSTSIPVDVVVTPR
jgi:wyosine [tRNA(Phe)-imidazoG37] synthetase (radical SAM superfamily)